MEIFKNLWYRSMFLLQNSKILSYLSSDSPYHQDAEVLFYRLTGTIARIYYLEGRVLNKKLIEDFRSQYKDLTFFHHFLSGTSAEFTIPEYQRMHFLIQLTPGLMIEYDSTINYKIYYLEKFEKDELEKIFKLIRKNTVIDWPKTYIFININ